jgi:hypothetical protein
VSATSTPSARRGHRADELRGLSHGDATIACAYHVFSRRVHDIVQVWMLRYGS